METFIYTPGIPLGWTVTHLRDGVYRAEDPATKDVIYGRFIHKIDLDPAVPIVDSGNLRGFFLRNDEPSVPDFADPEVDEKKLRRGRMDWDVAQ